jgi:hypothetical protein
MMIEFQIQALVNKKEKSIQKGEKSEDKTGEKKVLRRWRKKKGDRS